MNVVGLLVELIIGKGWSFFIGKGILLVYDGVLLNFLLKMV